MKPAPIFVAAAGFAMIGACSVKKEESAPDTADTNSAVAADENTAPVASDAAGADTLGNQLNQLNESDATAANEAANSTD